MISSVWTRSDVASRVGAPIALLMTENCGICLVTKPSNRGRRSLPSDRGPSIAAVSDREVAAMAEMTEAHELLLIEEADAWFEYLEATRGQSALRYTEIEPWAWARHRAAPAPARGSLARPRSS